jgi:pimeloyl-ACP methyl ester carboxylesterase
MHVIRLVLPEGMEVALELTPQGMFPLVGALVFPDDMSWERSIRLVRAERFGVSETLSVEAPRSGELVFLVRTTAPVVTQRYDLALRCTSGCDLETTRFPIMLVHGWTGFDEIGPLEYFYGIPGLLRGRGYEVEVALLDPYNSIEVRSEQLAPQIDELLARSRARKVNIIAHSQGGLDSRRLISALGYGDRVSALVTIATPHRGTPLCDAALGILPGFGEEALYFLLDLIGARVMGSEGDAEASFRSMTQEYVQGVFNPANPDDERVSYISWMGRTCLYGISCDDICDVEIRWSYDLIYLFEGANDGIVPVSSAPWGDYRGEVPADHFDEVGQLFGVTGEHFDHEAFYLARARDLAAEGH